MSDKNKLELKIENYELEIKELQDKVPESWKAKNGEFEILHKAKNTRTKRYRKNVDEAYLKNHGPIVIDRLALAIARLAILLEVELTE